MSAHLLDTSEKNASTSVEAEFVLLRGVFWPGADDLKLLVGVTNDFDAFALDSPQGYHKVEDLSPGCLTGFYVRGAR